MKRHPFTVTDLLALRRLGPAVASPDGETLVFAVSGHDVEENAVRTQLYRMPADGGPIEALTQSGTRNTAPAFAPNGRTLAFISNRGGTPQVWLLPLDGGDAAQLTAARDGVSAFAWAPDGRSVLFASTVTPSDATEGVRTADKLLFRHWNEWRDHHRNVVFRQEVATGQLSVLSQPEADCPPVALEGERDFDARPGTNEVALTWNPDSQPALGTNNTVWRVVDGRATAVTDSRACEADPRWSPDGRHLAWLAMERPGFEADLRHIWVLDTESGQTRCLTAGFDRPIRRFQWARGGDSILFDGQDRGRHTIWRVGLDGPVTTVLTGHYATLAGELPGGDLLVAIESLTAPADLWRLNGETGALLRLTDLNPRLGEVAWDGGRDLWWEGADGDPVHGFLVMPPGTPKTPVPLLVLVHGGPQSAFAAHFHYRWNPQVFAGAGYAVLLVNPRGSTGYGQAFTDPITGDWGGRVVTDLLAGIDHALAEEPTLDGERIAAAGGSYGGWMTLWLAGHSDRFRALVCHAGIFDMRNLYWGTEELWFPAWEMGGTPAEAPEAYDRWSPSRYTAKWKTPLLVLHGEQDFRVPVLEGMSAFTAAQVHGVPSRLVLFPEEAHWILQPKNAHRWYQEVVAWLDHHV